MTPGGTPLRITTTYGASDPDWSPNGRQIVYTRNTAVGRGDLLRRPQVTGADCKISAARASTPKGNSLWIAAANGSAAHQITRGPGDFAPMFSPDGRRIAYMRVAHNYQRWIYVANADGSHKHRLYRGDSPAWQPIPR
jgi:Tol biopolymer transport system component